MYAPKNANRQLAQYRRMIDRQRALLRYSFLFWLIPTGVLTISFVREWHWAVKTFLGICVLGGLAQHLNEWSRLKDYEAKRAKIEGAAHG